MKVLVVCQYYNPEPFRLSDICEELVHQGHEVTVVTGVPNYPEGEIYPGYEKSWGKETEENGVRIRRCFTIPRKTGILFRMLNYFSFAASSSWYLSSLKEEYDVVLVNQLSPVMMAEGAIRYAKRNRKKLILYCLDLWPESLTAGGIGTDSIIYKVFTAISRRIYSHADRILVTSKGFVPYLMEFLRVKTDCDYLPQYAEAMFDNVPSWKNHEGPFHFVFAGNIGEMQSVDTLIGAAALLQADKRVIFDIVGDGSALEQCKKVADGLTNVVFHGRKPVEDMPKFYELADAMIVSLKDNPAIANTLPGKVQSYMASGRAIMGSIGGETVSVISEGKCGVCAKPEDPQGLAAEIEKLLDCPELFGEYGSNGRLYYNRFFTKKAFMQKLIAELEVAASSEPYLY